MNIVIGDHPGPTSFDAQLTLTFYPEEFPVHWRRAALTADFAASWFGEAGELIADAISYALNELVENAIKFCTIGQIRITVGLSGPELVMIVENRMQFSDVPKLEALLRETVSEDPWELIVRRVEANAADPGTSQSGLGFLTLLTDYDALLGWSIAAEEGDTHACLSTVVRLKTHEG